MESFSSSNFVSAVASGENWRDVSKKALDSLSALMTDGFKPTIGFLYITEELAADAASILTLFRSVTGVERWSGCAAMGVCGGGAEFISIPAISVLIGDIPEDSFHVFLAQGGNLKTMRQSFDLWLTSHEPMLVVVHADSSEGDPARVLEELESCVGGFMVGGLASSRKQRAILGREAADGGVSGCVFSSDVMVATALSQGCVPMGPYHEVSKADNHVVAYLDGRPPMEVFSQEMSSMAEQRLGYKPKAKILSSEGQELPKDLSLLLSGEAHVAFPVSGSDQKDFMVRNIMAMDPDTGAMAIGDVLEDGMKMMFVHRDDQTVRSDLIATLTNLHKRVVQERGAFKPKAALYVSCVARAAVKFKEQAKPGGEMALLRSILGDIPIAGFYAAGEISNNRLYGHTGILTLFL